jgi:hypothetical protein
MPCTPFPISTGMPCIPFPIPDRNALHSVHRRTGSSISLDETRSRPDGTYAAALDFDSILTGTVTAHQHDERTETTVTRPRSGEREHSTGARSSREPFGNLFAEHAFAARRVFAFARDDEHAATAFFLLLREKFVHGATCFVERHSVQVEVCRDREFAPLETSERLTADTGCPRAHVTILVRDVEAFGSRHRFEVFLSLRFDLRQIGT